jgi:transposase
VARTRLAADQKNARRRGAVIIFVDETGFGFDERPGRTWAPTGQTPILRRVARRRELSTIAAVTISGKVFKRTYRHTVRGAQVVAMLRHLDRHIPGKKVIVWDRLNTHRAAVVKAYLRQHPEIQVEELPAYAPELNPEEYCHGNVKEHMRNTTAPTVEVLRTQVDRGFARVRQRPDLVLGFFRHAGLGINQLW